MLVGMAASRAFPMHVKADLMRANTRAFTSSVSEFAVWLVQFFSEHRRDHLNKHTLAAFFHNLHAKVDITSGVKEPYSTSHTRCSSIGSDLFTLMFLVSRG